jgi:tRNA(Arg) A34 adenosine deaminase TadA
MLYAQIHLTLPTWVHDEIEQDRVYPDAASRIALAIDLSRRNVQHRTGGPFGAAVFSRDGRLLGVGVNRVVPTSCSAAHAEVLALASSQ